MKILILTGMIAILVNLGYSAPIDNTSSDNPVAATNISIESIADQLNDIRQLLPKDMIKNIAFEHLQSDDEFKAAVKYLQSEEWGTLVVTVRDKPEWVALKKYLKETGLDLDVIIHCVEMFAENVTVVLEPKEPPPKKSFKKFLIDVEQNLPTVKILTTLHEKMSNGTLFQQLFEKLSSEESRILVENVIALPEIKRMMDILAEMDVNLYEMVSLMYTFFGWGDFQKP